MWSCRNRRDFPKTGLREFSPLCKSVNTKQLLSQSHSHGAQSNRFRRHHRVGVRAGLVLKHMTNEHASIWYIDGADLKRRQCSWDLGTQFMGNWLSFLGFQLMGGLVVGREGFLCLLFHSEYLPLRAFSWKGSRPINYWMNLSPSVLSICIENTNKETFK